MTYQEAVEFKTNKVYPFIYDSVLMKIVITPNSADDFNSFTNFYKSNKIDDFTAKKFSTDNEFAVYGFGPRIEYFFHLKLS